MFLFEAQEKIIDEFEEKMLEILTEMFEKVKIELPQISGESQEE